MALRRRGRLLRFDRRPRDWFAAEPHADPAAGQYG
jgi:hypothetical protein